MKTKILITAISILMISSCNFDEKKSDAYGNFEATEVIISSEASGRLLEFNVNQGETIKAGDLIGFVDTVPLILKRNQLEVQKSAVSEKVDNVYAQIEVINEQKKNLEIEKKRVEKLFKDGAATSKQIDDINGQMNVFDSQIKSIKTQNSNILNEVEVVQKQIEILDDQIARSYIKNPINGIVLDKFVEKYEMVVMGKSLYKISDMKEMELKAYISGDQLEKVKIGQKVEVLIDNSKDGFDKKEGIVSWIANQAEFTPKIIQTKEERVNLVYAIKVKVKNDGEIKIGMPGEVNFK